MVSIESLWISVKGTIENLDIISAIPIAIIVLFLIILIIIEKKLRKKIKIMKSDRNATYFRRINRIDQKDPKHTLERIDRIARDFFRERFGIKRAIEYSELESIFIKQNKKETAKFCSLINDLLYSGRITDEKINQELIQDLTSIIENNPITNRQEKKSVLEKIRDIELNIKERLFG